MGRAALITSIVDFVRRRVDRKGVASASFILCVLPLMLLLIAPGVFAQRTATPSVVSSIQEIRTRNVVMQGWELSCASAALATILRYQLGLPVTERSVALGMINREEYLRDPSLIRLRQGFSLRDMQRYVEKISLRGLGLGQLSFQDLPEYGPIIIPVVLKGYPHFVVFRGVLGDSVLIADPAFGNTTMSIEKFENAWIKYDGLGHVGFIVSRSETVEQPGRLALNEEDFVFLP